MSHVPGPRPVSWYLAGYQKEFQDMASGDVSENMQPPRSTYDKVSFFWVVWLVDQCILCSKRRMRSRIWIRTARAKS